jgi:hypothetical protein
MRDYQVERYDDIGCVIFSISEYNPTDYISTIEQDLIKESYKGNVVFDLLLANGNNFNRYLKAYFNGNGFNRDSYKIIDKPQHQLKKKSIDFYQKNIDFLENSILSKPIKFMIKKGYII